MKSAGRLLANGPGPGSERDGLGLSSGLRPGLGLGRRQRPRWLDHLTIDGTIAGLAQEGGADEASMRSVASAGSAEKCAIALPTRQRGERRELHEQAPEQGRAPQQGREQEEARRRVPSEATQAQRCTDDLRRRDFDRRHATAELDRTEPTHRRDVGVGLLRCDERMGGDEHRNAVLLGRRFDATWQVHDVSDPRVFESLSTGSEGARCFSYERGDGRTSWVTAADFVHATPDPLAPHAAGLLAHMNADHGVALVDSGRAFSKAIDTTAATMTSVDRYGFEMSATTGEGPRPAQVAFPRPLSTPDEVRGALVEQARP